MVPSRNGVYYEDTKSWNDAAPFQIQLAQMFTASWLLEAWQEEWGQPCDRKKEEFQRVSDRVDIAEVRTKEGKLYLHVAIDRTSKFAYAQLHKTQTKTIAASFLENLIGAVPYKIHKVLTDNGIEFTNHDRHVHAFAHIFARVCDRHEIEDRKTKVKHPWTNGQVERMNRTIDLFTNL